MATRRVPPQSDEEQTGAVGFADGSTLETPALDEIAEDAIITRTRALISERPGEQITIKLYRLSETNARVFCCNYSPDKFSQGDLEMVRKDWGPGRFEIRMIGKTGLLDRPREFEIAPMYLDPGAAQAPAQTQQSPELVALLRVMADSQAAILRALSDKPAVADPLAQFQQFAAIMRDMREANPAPIAAPAVSPTAMLSELMGALKTLKEVAAEAAPPPASDDPMAMLPTILGIVKESMAGRSNNPTPGGAEFPMIAQPASIANAGTLQPEQPEQTEPMNITAALVLRGTLQKLIELAAANADPAVGGQFIYEKIPDEMLQYFDLTNWFEIVESFEPKIKPYREWMTKVKAHADAEFAKDDAEGSETA